MTDADQAPETAVERWIRKNPETADGVGFPVGEYEAEAAVSRAAVLATDRLQVRVAELEALRDGWRRAAQDLRAARDEAQRIARTLFHQNPGPRDAAVELDVHLGITTPPGWLTADAADRRHEDGPATWTVRGGAVYDLTRDLCDYRGVRWRVVKRTPVPMLAAVLPDGTVGGCSYELDTIHHNHGPLSSAPNGDPA